MEYYLGQCSSKEGSVSGDAVTQAAQITNTEKTLVEYSITLSEPGEFYEFTVDAKNEGTIDGMINVVSNKTYESNGTTEKSLPEYLTYSVTYSDGKTIAPKQLLKAGTTEKYKVRVEFKDVAADKLPAQEETIKFKFSVEYVQADETGEEVVHGLTGTRYTTNKLINNDDNEFVWIGKKPTDNIILYETATEARAAFNNSKMWLKHEIENDIVKESYVCFERNNNTYCLRGGVIEEDDDGYPFTNKPVYDANKQVLTDAFGASNCSEHYDGHEAENEEDWTDTGLNFECRVIGEAFVISPGGYADYIIGGFGGCSSYDKSVCREWQRWMGRRWLSAFSYNIRIIKEKGFKILF